MNVLVMVLAIVMSIIWTISIPFAVIWALNKLFLADTLPYDLVTWGAFYVLFVVLTAVFNRK